jgi:rubrerythrin
MAVVACPECNSDDIDRDAEQTTSGVIGLRCLSCGHVFTREPIMACARCASTDVASRGYEGWGYDDPEAARENPDGAAWSSYNREQFRCLKCNYTWRHSGPAHHSPPNELS